MIPIITDVVHIDKRVYKEETLRDRYANAQNSVDFDEKGNPHVHLSTLRGGTTASQKMFNELFLTLQRTAWQDWSTEKRVERWRQAGDIDKGI